MALRTRNLLSSGRATLNPRSTFHGPLPEPKIACGVRAGSLGATDTRPPEKTRGRKRNNAKVLKEHIYLCIYPDRLGNPFPSIAPFCRKREKTQAALKTTTNDDGTNPKTLYKVQIGKPTVTAVYGQLRPHHTVMSIRIITGLYRPRPYQTPQTLILCPIGWTNWSSVIVVLGTNVTDLYRVSGEIVCTPGGPH